MVKHTNEPRTEISGGASIHGTVRGSEDLVVHGRIDGSIELEGALYVETDGIVKADVAARRVAVVGILVGDVSAAETIEIGAQGRVVGNLTAPAIRVAEGARFSGGLTIGEEGRPARRIEERPRPERAERIEVPPLVEDDTKKKTPVTSFNAPKTPQEERRKKRVVIKKRR